jgi:hypothetical protein
MQFPLVRLEPQTQGVTYFVFVQVLQQAEALLGCAGLQPQVVQ